MDTPDQDPTPGTREHFLQVTALRRWGTIQEYVELCRAQGYFTAAFYRNATAHMERIHVLECPRIDSTDLDGLTCKTLSPLPTWSRPPRSSSVVVTWAQGGTGHKKAQRRQRRRWAVSTLAPRR
jgi:hypothetical protein